VEGVIGLTIKLVAEEVGAVEMNGIEVRFFQGSCDLFVIETLSIF
jgi:hypothetical protein